MTSIGEMFNGGNHTTNLVHSKGRVAPVAPQAIVVTTCMADRRLSAKRRNRAKKAAPYHTQTATADVYSLERGELAFADEKQILEMQASNDVGFVGASVYTSFNNILEDDVPIFVGTIDKRFDAMKPKSDNAVTVRRSGTCSIVNSGKGRINHGDIVYWNIPIVTQGEKPASTVSGISKDKFLASVEAIPDGVVGMLDKLAETDNFVDENKDELLRIFSSMNSLSRRRIGIALNSCERGKQLNLLMGY
jgi:hypothetical protein